ncbi:MAG: SOS response-associated peptidase [Pirellulaceae bacterium]|nr:SOS response-associated peptidase [Pirellulaceae bacterium]
MCGRLTLKTAPELWAQILLPFGCEPDLPGPYRPRYNIAPSQWLWTIATVGDRPAIIQMRWGLLPSWATELEIGNRMINARRETLLEKRSFQEPLKHRRCLILADGYYEWRMIAARSKQPYWISAANGSLLLLAGLWERNVRATGRELISCTIITTAANSAMSSVHDRMPVPLVGQAAQRWLQTDCEAQEAYGLLGPVDESFFRMQPVSSWVNNARNEGPDCLAAPEGVDS